MRLLRWAPAPPSPTPHLSPLRPVCSRPGTSHVHFESAAVIVTLILLGRGLEARAKGRTGAAIERLIGLKAKSARVLREGARLKSLSTRSWSATSSWSSPATKCLSTGK